MVSFCQSTIIKISKLYKFQCGYCGRCGTSSVIQRDLKRMYKVEAFYQLQNNRSKEMSSIFK